MILSPFPSLFIELISNEFAFSDYILVYLSKLTAPAAAATSTSDAIAAAIKMIDERDKNKSESKVVISTVTQSRVNRLYEQVGFSISEGDPYPSSDLQFEPFFWNGRKEDEALEDARAHIESQLRKFKVPLGRGGYKVVDVRTMKDLLNVVDDRIGEISGGTDIIIVPFKTAKAGYRKAINVIFEIKTEVNMTKGRDQFESQCFVELLAARCISDQPYVLVVLTDLASEAVLFEIEYNERYKRFTVHQATVTLDQVGTNVANFLTAKAVPDVNFRALEDENNPRDFPVIEFKKTKLSHDVGLALEHFNEMREDTEPNSRERALLAADLFRAMEVPMPTLLQYMCE